MPLDLEFLRQERAQLEAAIRRLEAGADEIELPKAEDLNDGAQGAP